MRVRTDTHTHTLIHLLMVEIVLYVFITSKKGLTARIKRSGPSVCVMVYQWRKERTTKRTSALCVFDSENAAVVQIVGMYNNEALHSPAILLNIIGEQRIGSATIQPGCAQHACAMSNTRTGVVCNAQANMCGAFSTENSAGRWKWKPLH